MHPLPEDVSRVNTYDIVEKIRCEAKEGLRGVRADSNILKNTAIGYDFTFDIDEDNNATNGKLKFERPGFRDGSNTTWEFTGSSTRKRKNKRVFRIVERLEKLNAANCSEGATRANWVYPITGAVGMGEVLRTYIGLERLTDFGTGLKSDSTVFSEELEFTTEFGGGVTPTLELATIAGKFRLTNATIFAEAKRKDIHSLTVALAKEGELDDPKKKTRRSLSLSRSLDVVPLRTAAALAESVETAENRVVIELERRRRLKEDEFIATRLIEALRPSP